MRLMEELSTLSVPAEYTHSTDEHSTDEHSTDEHSTDEHSTDEHTSRAPGESGQQRRQSRVSNVNLRPFAAVHVSPPPRLSPYAPPYRTLTPLRPTPGRESAWLRRLCMCPNPPAPTRPPPPLLDPPRPY